MALDQNSFVANSLAGPQLEIYTTGGGTYLVDSFNFVASFTNSGNFAALTTIAITLSVIYFSFKLMWGEGFKDVAKWFLLVAVVGTVMIGAKSSVVIFDKTKSKLPIAIVDNVPYGIALVGHYTSSLGNSLTELFEAGLSTPDSIGYQKNGMFFGAGMLAQTTRWRLTSTRLHSTLDNFIKNCTLDGSLIGTVSFDEVAKSGRLADTLISTSPQSLAYYDEFLEQTVTCADGVATLAVEFDLYIDKLLISKANAMFSDNSSEGSPDKVNRLTDTLDGFMSMISTGAMSSRDQLAQGVLIQALDAAIMGYISESGNAAAMEHYRAARAESQTSASYKASFTQATKWIPVMKVAFEFVYYTFFPIALFLMMTPLAFTVMRGYFGGFIWLASWEPISSMLHAIVIRRSAGYYREAGLITQDGSTEFVVNFSNHLGIRSVEYDISVLAGSMMTLVPFLAFGLVMGANKFAQLSTSMTNVSQGAAIETGKESATGNHQLATVSANKFNTSALMDHGRKTTFLDGGASTTLNRDGSIQYGRGSAASEFMVGANLAQSFRRASTARLEQAQSVAKRTASEHRKHLDTTRGVYSELMERSARSDGFSDSGGNSYSTADQKRVSRSKSRIEDFAKSQGLSTDMAMTAALAAGLDSKGQTALFANLKANGQLSGVSRESFDKSIKAAESAGITRDVSSLEQFRRESGWQSSQDWGLGENQGERHLLNEGKSLSKTASNAQERVKRASKSDEYVQSMAVEGSTGLANVVQDYMQRKGYSPDQISAILNPRTQSDLQKGTAVQSGVLDFIASSLGIGSVLPNTAGITRDADLGSPLLRSANPGRDGIYNPGSVEAFKNDNRPPDFVIERPSHIGSAQEEIRKGFEGHKAAIRKQENEVNANAGRDTVEITKGADQTAGVGIFNRVRKSATDWASGLLGSKSSNTSTPSNVDTTQGWAQLSNSDIYPSLGTTGNVQTGALGPSAPYQGQMGVFERDAVIRTVIGEAGSQNAQGMAAVAHVIKNRVEDPRWAGDINGVVFQNKAFSAWNKGAGGNDLVNKYKPGDAQYERVGQIVDSVFDGSNPDLTQGATHYYSPAGMQKLVNDGDQSNLLPNWLQEQQALRPNGDLRLGGHIFTGKKG